MRNCLSLEAKNALVCISMKIYGVINQSEEKVCSYFLLCCYVYVAPYVLLGHIDISEQNNTSCIRAINKTQIGNATKFLNQIFK
jgi:hypothetical protein